jgi:aldehyde:ferredoxin oxidoreductase
MGALPRFEYLQDSKSAKEFFGSEEAADRFGVHGKGALVSWKENLFAVYDSLNICKRISTETSSFKTIHSLSYPLLAEIYTATTGISLTPQDLERAGERICNLERLFNIRCGLRRQDDTLPDRFLKTKFKKGGAADKTVPLDQMLDEYYNVRGWDTTTGIPLPETLEKLGLDEFIVDLP